MKATKEQLINAADEIYTEMGIDKPVDPKATEVVIKKWLKKAAGLYKPEEDDFSEETFETLEMCGIYLKRENDEDPEGEGEGEDETTLEQELDDTDDMRELKAMVKANDEFKPLRSALTKYKAGKEDDLKDAMYELLNPEDEDPEEEPEEEAPPTKKAPTRKPAAASKKPAAAAKEKPAAAAKKPGVIATIVALIEKSGKKGITKDELLEKLAVAFPDREEDSMKNTVNVQVPNRISKEKFPVGKTKTGRYFKQAE